MRLLAYKSQMHSFTFMERNKNALQVCIALLIQLLMGSSLPLPLLLIYSSLVPSVLT